MIRSIFFNAMNLMAYYYHIICIFEVSLKLIQLIFHNAKHMVALKLKIIVVAFNKIKFNDEIYTYEGCLK